MELNYQKSESIIYPELIDKTSSKKVVYLRKNVVEKQVKDEFSDEFYNSYEYEEAKISKKDYEEYLKEIEEKEIKQQRADIDYIALMTGVDLDETEV